MGQGANWAQGSPRAGTMGQPVVLAYWPVPWAMAQPWPSPLVSNGLGRTNTHKFSPYTRRLMLNYKDFYQINQLQDVNSFFSDYIGLFGIESLASLIKENVDPKIYNLSKLNLTNFLLSNHSVLWKSFV